MKIQQSLTDGYKILKENPIIFLPALIIALLTAYFQTISTEFGSISRIVVWLLILFLSSLVFLFFGCTIIKMVYDARRRRLSLIGAMKFVLSKYITLLVSSIIFTFIILLGFVALIIPGIFLLVKLFFYDYSILIDNEGIISSLKRSWKITKGNWWDVFALLMVTVIIASIPSSIIGFIFVIMSLPLELLPVPSFLLNLFFIPWSLSVFTFAYLQLRK